MLRVIGEETIRDKIKEKNKQNNKAKVGNRYEKNRNSYILSS